MKENTFTPGERLQLRQSLLELYRNKDIRPSSKDARQLWTLMEQALEKGASMRDAFGFNKITIALESVKLAANEIGLCGNVLPAFILSFILGDLADAEEFIKKTPRHWQDSLHGLLRTQQLNAKTEAMKTDNFRNLFVTQAGDMRNVLLLIAWCVVVMRNIKDTPNVAEQRRVSIEAAYLYAPLAHKLGLYTLKSELEDLSLKYLEHDAYYMIKENLNATKRSRDAYIERFIAPIAEMLNKEGLRYHIKGRTKSIHSIWQKMKKQQCGFNGVYDLFAIRIILDSPRSQELKDCWNVFSLITGHYEPNLKRLRDWVTVPKSNGYESLHITVRGPEDKWVEVQIRTERMDEVAEHGLAAHWRYKGVKSSEGGVDAWLADIRSALETGNEQMLCENLSEKVNKREVYVFTPKGDLYRLPPESTVLDFAYHIHSNIGNHCVGGRINGRGVSIRQKLESGDHVEILTATSQMPRLEWLNIAVSSHARSKIRTAVRDLQAREGVLARELLERKLKNRKIDWDEAIINQLIKKTGYKESTEFYKAIAEERLDPNALIERYQELAKREQGLAERAATRSAGEFTMEKEKDQTTASSDDVLIIDRNLKGIDFQMARCCNPVYGDDVFGFVTVNGGIKIHRTNCPNAPALRQRFGYRIVPAKWAGKGDSKYPITLHVVGNDDLGIVNNITSIISKEEKIMLRSISIDSNDGLFSGALTIMVGDTQALNVLIKKLNGVKGVKAVSRT